MKKSLKALTLKKEVVSKLQMKEVKGAGGTHCCPTDGPLNTCPPPGVQCY